VPLELAATVSAAGALAAWWSGTLTSSGAIAAWIVGLLILHGTGWQGGAVLVAFFVSSNLISRVTPGAPRLDPKGDRRDAWQVFANGGPAAVGAALTPPGSHLGLWIVTTTLAAAAADTWATSVGTLSRTPPRLVWSGRIVPAGTSGGMTVSGTAAAAVGALIVSASGTLAGGSPLLLPLGTLIGFLGMVADSLLGGLLQGRFHCPVCDEASEWPVHRCGAATTRRGGLAWLNNDGVNLIATALAAGAGWAAWGWFSSPP
jgi:uncharacterized protein (TIGR00297 family)